jgi:hypothetical protein
MLGTLHEVHEQLVAKPAAAQGGSGPDAATVQAAGSANAQAPGTLNETGDLARHVKVQLIKMAVISGSADSTGRGVPAGVSASATAEAPTRRARLRKATTVRGIPLPRELQQVLFDTADSIAA